MSAFPNPIPNIASPFVRQPPVEPRSRYRQPDPQLDAFLDQKVLQTRVLIFQLQVLERGAGQAIQEILPKQNTPQEVDAGHAPTNARESPEMRWLTRNATALERYRGEWLLIQGNELLAHSDDFDLIRATITDREIPAPFVYYVPTEEESQFIAI